jgi:hypothetical protein
MFAYAEEEVAMRSTQISTLSTGRFTGLFVFLICDAIIIFMSDSGPRDTAIFKRYQGASGVH